MAWPTNEQLDAFDAQLAKVVAAVRERWSN
jgi:hypothetical protein